MNYDKYKVSFVTLDSRASKSFNDVKEAFDFARKIKNKVEALKIVGIKDGVKNELELDGSEKKKKANEKKAAVKKSAVKKMAKGDEKEFSKEAKGKSVVVSLSTKEIGWISNAIRYTLNHHLSKSSLTPFEKDKISKNLNNIIKVLNVGSAGSFSLSPTEISRIELCLRRYYIEILKMNKSKAPSVLTLLNFFKELKNDV